LSRNNLFTGLAEFLAVARHASFRAAGAELGVTPSAVSQAVRALEKRVGLPLFQRTTRKVAITEAGLRLLEQLSPAAATVGEAMESLRAMRDQPAGTLRLSVPRIALELVLLHVIPAFRAAYPEVTLNIDINDASVDLTGAGFDAGIRIGEFIERDMVAVRLTEDFRWIVAGSPGYFAAHGKPSSPKDLIGHECIRYRFPTAGTIYRWQFVRNKREFSVEPRGNIAVNDHLAMIDFAKQGLGLAYTADLVAAPALASRKLEEVLRPYLPTKPGLFLYFPARSQEQPKLRAFIDVAKGLVRSSSPGKSR
jgi:DNA-binding transcriptional LysR family regulator